MNELKLDWLPEVTKIPTNMQMQKISAKEVGLLVASFYSNLTKIDHDDSLENKID